MSTAVPTVRDVDRRGQADSASHAQSFGQSVSEAFPTVEPGLQPFGSRVLVQIRRAPRRTRGGLEIPDIARETEKWNTQTAKVIALGPLAFHNRQTMEPWPEGAWCKPGDYVRVSKYAGDRFEVPCGSDDDPVVFVMFNDLDIIGRITSDPRSIKAYV